jgi:hypothetical protein
MLAAKCNALGFVALANYGMRAVKDSNIGTWPDRATDWLLRRDLGRAEVTAEPDA